MDSTSGFSTPKQASALKRDYRILRSKVLKILDQKFFHPHNDIVQHEARMTQIQTAFKKIMDREAIENAGLNKKPSKIIDYDHYNKNINYNRYLPAEKEIKVKRDQDILTIENLCKYLSLDEIELICEDPIYFLGREEYQVNNDLNDHKGWNRMLEWVKDKRRKENNWHLTAQKIKTEVENMPNKEVFAKMSSKYVRAYREPDFENKQEAKEVILKSHSRRIIARNNQMNSLVRIRKIEEIERKKERDAELAYRQKDRSAKVIEKKKEAFDMMVKEREMDRFMTQKKLDTKERDKRDKADIRKINHEINAIFKERMVEKCRNSTIRDKINKARTFTDFRYRKQYARGLDVEDDRGSDFSRSQSPIQ